MFNDFFFESEMRSEENARYDYARETYAGETYAGETYAGETYAGETYAGETYAGEDWAHLERMERYEAEAEWKAMDAHQRFEMIRDYELSSIEHRRWMDSKKCFDDVAF